PYPHFPPVPRTYYMHSEVKGGGWLDKYLLRFCPATDIDAMLIRAFHLSLFAGLPPGALPSWVITTDEDGLPSRGVGVGKTRLAILGSHLVGGYIDISPLEDVGTIKTRLLSPQALGKRVALIDNIKSHRFSWGELENLITAAVISGRRLYKGEGRRP